MIKLPSPDTMLVYASILEKPKYYVHEGHKYLSPNGEIIEAAILALRYCAALKLSQANVGETIIR